VAFRPRHSAGLALSLFSYTPFIRICTYEVQILLLRRCRRQEVSYLAGISEKLGEMPI
jgi:hypothetical protein